METPARRSDGLPDNVLLFEVLTWLPAKSLCRFKQVCRLWRSTIAANRFFILRQAQRQTCISSAVIYRSPRHDNLGFFPTCGASVGVPDPSLGFPEGKKIDIIACVHGLLLLHVYLIREQFLYICNPATGEGMRIPGGIRGGIRRDHSCFGLAFDPRASPDRYTLIKANWSHQNFSFEIFSSNTGRWMNSSAKPMECSIDYMPNKVVFAGGVVYWHLGKNILSYDAFENAAQVIMGPPEMSTRANNCIDEIGVWEERLTCCRPIDDKMQVWLMRRKKREWEWEMRHCIPLNGVFCLRPRLFSRWWCKLWLGPLPYEGGKNIYMRIKVNGEEKEVEAKEVIVKLDIEAKDAEVIGEVEARWSDWPQSFSYHNSLVALPYFPHMK